MLELQLQHQFFSEYSGLISFRIDWVVNCCQLQSLLSKEALATEDRADWKYILRSEQFEDPLVVRGRWGIKGDAVLLA